MIEEKDPIADIYKVIKTDEPYCRLVEAFYAGVETDELLRPLYPQDLKESKEHLALFLIQRTGGHQTYSIQRGHPRMRARHMPFKIGIFERNAWLHHMKNALDSTPEFASCKDSLYQFFEGFATFLINSNN